MKTKKNTSSKMSNNRQTDIELIKNKIKKIHKSNKDNVPKYLDILKKEKNIQVKEATFDNEFLKYML